MRASPPEKVNTGVMCEMYLMWTVDVYDDCHSYTRVQWKSATIWLEC